MKAFLDILKPNELIYPNTVSIGWRQGKVERPQGHPYYHWLQTDQGEGTIKIAGKVITLYKHDGILISPFVPHTYFSKQHWQTNYITLCGYATTFFPKLLGEQKFYLLRDVRQVATDLAQLADGLERGSSDKMISQLTYQIFTELRATILKTTVGKNSASPIYWEAKKYLDSHYMQKITINQMSQDFHVSPQYLIKIFKQTVGVSPYQYLLNRRISEAKKLLVSNHDLLISEIATLVGMDNVSHFIELFKRYENCTPLEFRTIFYQGRDAHD